MSSKKIYVTVGIDENIAQALEAEAIQTDRSRSNLFQKILRDYFKSKEQGDKQWPLNFRA